MSEPEKKSYISSENNEEILQEGEENKHWKLIIRILHPQLPSFPAQGFILKLSARASYVRVWGKRFSSSFFFSLHARRKTRGATYERSSFFRHGFSSVSHGVYGLQRTDAALPSVRVWKSVRLIERGECRSTEWKECFRSLSLSSLLSGQKERERQQVNIVCKIYNHKH